MRRDLIFVASVSFAFLISTSCSNGGGSSSCPAGDETCACNDDGTCNAGLECRSNLCVAGAASGGTIGGSTSGETSGTTGTTGPGTTTSGTTGASGTTGLTTGSSTTGGSTTGTSTTSGGSTTGRGTTGASTTGATTGSTTGSTGTSGTTSGCGNTMTDPNNCGRCGHVCKAGKCQAGQCDPYPQGCFTQTDGFATCTAYCTSIGESCVAAGCNRDTDFSWSSDRQNACLSDPTSAQGHSNESCDATLEFDPSIFYYRCCCTNTK